jgi:hypothetical protein
MICACFADDGENSTLDAKRFALVISNENNWNIKEKGTIKKSDEIYRTVELVGALRINSPLIINALIKTINYPNRLVGGLPRGFSDYFVAASLVRIGNAEIIEQLIKKYAQSGKFGSTPTSEYFFATMPCESFLAFVTSYIKSNQSILNTEEIDRLNHLTSYINLISQKRQPRLPPLSDYILSHPLYKSRQSAIEANLSILKDQKKNVLFDTKASVAVTKLGELRSVEAITILVPLLLIKPDTTVKPNDEKIEEYEALKEYPVAVVLAQIGIPSIWGLLDEIAVNNHDENYYQTAYQTMTTILPAVTLPGFVHESLKKHTNELAQLRLYKMYPLMGLPIEGTPLIPQLREWQSTDKLFKTNAKFISLDNGDVTLERANGQCTTIEYSVLRKEDQDYVKEQLNPETKTPKNETMKD